jgi:hypothetical protein
MKLLLLGALFAGSAVAAPPDTFHSGTSAAAPAHPALYSFSDVYRLTVGGPMAGVAPLDTAPDAPIRVAVTQAQPAEARFTITHVPQPDKWLLVLAGLALAGWVAHRRLVHAL